MFVLDDVRPLEQFSAQVAGEAFHLFTPGPGIEFDHWLYDARWETDYTAYRPPNPDDGTYIDFYVGAHSLQSAGIVKFRVTGPDGQVVATTSAAAHPGVDRYMWDMRYADSKSLDFVKPPPVGPGPPGHDVDPNQGPLVPPGQYELRAQYGDITKTTSIKVIGDPNVGYDQNLYADYAREALVARDTLSHLAVLVNTLYGLKVQTAQIAASLDKSPSHSRERLRRLLKAAADSVDAMNLKTYGSASHVEIARSSLYQQTLTLARELAATYPYRLPATTVNSIQSYKDRVDGYVAQYNAEVVHTVNAYNSAAKQAHAPQVSMEMHALAAAYRIVDTPATDD
jgi:hypothetical protein